jgi:hypothetical protein
VLRAVIVIGAVSSLATVQHFGGWTGLAIYAAVMAALAAFAPRPSIPGGWPLLIGALVVVAAVFVVVYPIADARRIVGAGSDADDALDILVRRLLAGDYPYTERTYRGNLISPLPGWGLLAAPFWLAFGRTAYLSVLWIGAWMVALAVAWRQPVRAGLVVLGALAVFPVAGVTFLNGGDYMAIGSALVVLFVLAEQLPPRWLPALAVLAGLVLSSRLNVPLVLPVLVGCAWRAHGRGPALGFGAISAGVFLATTLPAYLAAPADFAPVATNYAKLRGLGTFAVAVPALTGLLSLWLGWRARRAEIGWAMAAAAVLACPVAVAAAADGSLRLLDYGVFAIPLWVAALHPHGYGPVVSWVQAVPVPVSGMYKKRAVPASLKAKTRLSPFT